MACAARLAVWLRCSAAAAGYGLLACLITWPLPRHLRDALLGSPSGDTGIYVWNLWIFRHELLRHGRLPFSTSYVFGYTGGADLSMHNYTPIAGVFGLPLIGPLGVVGAFNAILLFSVALSGLGTFVLARRLGLRHAAAWAAGALFMASPVLVARQTAHFSLVIAAALPLFLWALLRALDRRRVADAIITGAIVAAAFFSDAYYGIFCVIMGGFIVAWRFTRVEWRGRAAIPAWMSWALNLAIAGAATLIVWRVLSGTTGIGVGPIMIGLQTMYTPVLWLVCFVTLRAWLTWRPVVIPQGLAGQWASLARLGLIAAGVCLLLLWPVILGIGVRALEGRLPDSATYWRSSPQGVDVLAYLVPNPSHPWFGDRTRQWFMPDKPDAFPEFVGSFSIVALAVVAVAGWLRALPRLWAAFTGFFVLLSLGPFVHVGGVNTCVIGPWALLRYVPVIGMARSPSRFAIVAVLGMSLLFAFAVQELARRGAVLRRAGAGILAAALMFELLPAPRRLYSAAVPDVYRLVAATGDDSKRLLELPTGIRDGTSSLGDFNASSAFFQTEHRRPLIGGYLSRVSPWRQREKARGPMMRALLTLSEGGTLSPERRATAMAARDQFLKRACVGFVIVNKQRASAELKAFAVDALRLLPVYEDPAFALFTPADPPACGPAPAHPQRSLRNLARR